MAMFALAAGVNTGSVLAEQRWGLLSRAFGGRAWKAHLAAITPLWALAVMRLWRLEPSGRWPLPAWLRWLGWGITLAALVVWGQSVAAMGLVRFANGACFGWATGERIRDGGFRRLRNPIYDSYALALVGSGLRKGDARYLLLALESFVLLNLIEAPIEDRCLITPPR
ncbi:MAG TPA: methyltransferase [Chloroflexota bacterium]